MAMGVRCTHGQYQKLLNEIIRNTMYVNSTEKKVGNQEQYPNNDIALIGNGMKMSTVEIAEQTGKRHDNVLRDTKAMLVELYGNEGCLRFEATYFTKGKELPCYKLPKNEVLTLISGYSIPLRAKIVRRLDELENGNPQYRMDNWKKDSFELQLLGVKYASDILRCSDVSRLQMVHAVHEYNQVPTVALPVYIEKVRVTFSAKDLLEKNDCGISTISFNKKMVAAGYLEE